MVGISSNYCLISFLTQSFFSSLDAGKQGSENSMWRFLSQKIFLIFSVPMGPCETDEDSETMEIETVRQ